MQVQTVLLLGKHVKMAEDTNPMQEKPANQHQ